MSNYDRRTTSNAETTQPTEQVAMTITRRVVARFIGAARKGLTLQARRDILRQATRAIEQYAADRVERSKSDSWPGNPMVNLKEEDLERATRDPHVTGPILEALRAYKAESELDNILAESLKNLKKIVARAWETMYQ